MAEFSPIPTNCLDEGYRQKTHVSLRIELPPTTHATTVHVVGSWDNFRTATPLEQDRRVGREIWKGIISQNGGLEMGAEYQYYFLLDQIHCIPNPQSSPASLTLDPRTGKLISVMYVPIELCSAPQASIIPQTQTEPPVSRVAAKEGNATSSRGATAVPPPSVFLDFDDEPEDQRVEDKLPSRIGITEPAKDKCSLRHKFQVRKTVSSLLVGSSPDPQVEHKAKRRLGWGLTVSTAFLRSKKMDAERTPGELAGEVSYNAGVISKDEKMKDIAGYIRSSIESTQQPHYPPANKFNSASSSIGLPLERSPRDVRKQVVFSAASSVYSQEQDAPETTNPADNSPGTQYSFYSSGDEDEDFDIETPIDSPGLGITARSGNQTENSIYPRYYNFDELITGQIGDEGISINGTRDMVKPLGCLRDEVAGELKWRDEIVDELGYLGGVLV